MSQWRAGNDRICVAARIRYVRVYASVAELQDVGAEDDEAVGPDGVFGGAEGAKGSAAGEGKAERALFEEGDGYFLAESDPEASLAEAICSGYARSRVGG